jgi:t-SNARE complex subunit (syntaxin)
MNQDKSSTQHSEEAKKSRAAAKRKVIVSVIVANIIWIIVA